jgi:hypothetical protein
MQQTAKGDFTVKVTPQPQPESHAEPTPSRFLLDKQYFGDLEATSQGQMLAAGDGKPGSSGAYVAIEKITGTLHGRKGSFVLYHHATMTKACLR